MSQWNECAKKHLLKIPQEMEEARSLFLSLKKSLESAPKVNTLSKCETNQIDIPIDMQAWISINIALCTYFQNIERMDLVLAETYPEKSEKLNPSFQEHHRFVILNSMCQKWMTGISITWWWHQLIAGMFLSKFQNQHTICIIGDRNSIASKTHSPWILLKLIS